MTSAVTTPSRSEADEAPAGLRTRLLNALGRLFGLHREPPDDNGKEGQTEPAPEITANDADKILMRSVSVREWWIAAKDPEAGKKADELGGTTGLALSGGGIRSATFSLGALQALARANRLKEVDVVSSVSGGSYIGCFVRSLFLPQSVRGISTRAEPGSKEPRKETRRSRMMTEARDGLGKRLKELTSLNKEPDARCDGATVPQPSLDEIRSRYLFAMNALRSSPSDRTLWWPPKRPGVEPAANEHPLKIRNPIWWLREHSRYLAPNGPTDYGYAVAYLARNWVGMIYVFSLAAAGVLTACALLDLLVIHFWPAWMADWFRPPAPAASPIAAACDIHLSRSAFTAIAATCDAAAATPKPRLLASLPPLLALAIIPQVASLGVSVAYWLTCQMSPNEPRPLKQADSFFTCLAGVLLVAFFLSPVLWGGRLANPHVAFTLWTTAGVFGLEISIGLVWFLCALLNASPDQLLTAELRRQLTDWQARFNLCVLVLLAFALLEALAEALRAWFWSHGNAKALSIGTALPLIAVTIHKLQGWAAGASGGSAWFKVATRFAPAVALVAGFTLYGAVAVVVGAGVQAAVWDGSAWVNSFDVASTSYLAAFVAALGLLTGLSTGFINLSSLHSLYASRLTRAYLGATNQTRLRTIEDPGAPDVTIKDNHHEDYIQPKTYAMVDVPAPIHIIAITANRTVDESSSIVARDRRGELVTVEPQGIQLGSSHDRKLLRWGGVGERDYAESLSLGQWCAISGAAASSGMGRLTNLGYALALSFANVRLGYWWWVPAGRPPLPRRPWYRRALSFLALPVYRLLSTFVYLFDEMTARYSRTYDRQYLSDGGHFENTGAYALIRRDVDRIVVCDNAQDEDYAFADLENLVRKARLDLGREIELLSGPRLRKFLESIGCTRNSIFVDAEKDPAWKASMAAGRGRAFALAFRIRATDPTEGGRETSTMVLVKPRLLPDIPQDVAGYAAANPAFPQQTTGDQFFDEAQWESYRRLGEHCMAELLDACPRLLRRLAAGPNASGWEERS